MKAGQRFALITGIIFTLIGLMGFIPAFVQQSTQIPPLMTAVGVEQGYGYLMGLFPVNVVHNFVHLAVGFFGLAASRTLGASRLYAGGLTIFYGLLTVMGLIPYSNTTFGLIPIFGNDVWLHALTAAIALYFGFIKTPDLLEISREQREASQQYSNPSGT